MKQAQSNQKSLLITIAATSTFPLFFLLNVLTMTTSPGAGTTRLLGVMVIVLWWVISIITILLAARFPHRSTALRVFDLLVTVVALGVTGLIVGQSTLGLVLLISLLPLGLVLLQLRRRRVL